VNLCRTCNRPLTEFVSPAGAVPGCSPCGHRLLEHTALEELQRSVQRHYTPDDVRELRAECKERKRATAERRVVYLDCPGCGNQLLRRTFGQLSFLLVNYCATHGYWIHKDELDGIAAYLERGGELLEMEAVQSDLAQSLRHLEGKNRDLEKTAAQAQAFIPLMFIAMH